MAKMEIESISSACNKFSNKLFTELCKEEGNVFFSPLSIHTCLSMLMQGAETHTKELIVKGLGVEKELAALGYQALLQNLNDIPHITLHLANKIYVKEEYKMNKSFHKTLTDNFLAEAEAIAFHKPGAADNINQWCKDKTNQKIDKLIEQSDLKESTRMILLNAIYFKGAWNIPFEKANTKKSSFYIRNDETVEVDMMYIEDKFNYKFDKDLDAQILRIPYKNFAVSMIVVLPMKKDGIKKLESKLAGYDCSKLTESMRREEVHLHLPKFKIETDMDLNPILSNIGLNCIFDGPTDFSSILVSPEALRVDKVKQKAFIEVNEEGAEAAAVTGIMMVGCTMFIPKEPILFKADHPFVFQIQHEEDINTFTLFHGRVSNPN